ncbi:hypothetical protein N7532_001710 [Penicillium argentinense]|uniref:C2H2-type domain-containing protein n=1 Tax=Penicillium argentinense TaxID=1131581 RepID=A0A9W9G2Z8_9EURO|nr:uncharacterized protein N7532_001710 [Penicillium argentinense]KAJ5111175.1 hypothetical protein N7532_001710 [Penicillium argentinense]
MSIPVPLPLSKQSHIQLQSSFSPPDMQSPFSYSDSYASSYASSPGDMDFFYGMGPPQPPIYDPQFDTQFDLDPASPFVPETIPEVHPEIHSFTSSPYMYSTPPPPVKGVPVQDFQMYEVAPMPTSVPSPPSSTCGSSCWNGPEEVPMPSYPLTEDSCPDSPSAAKPTKPFACDAAGCTKSFTRFADLKRHQSSVHYPVFRNCPVDHCSRKGGNGFPRQDHLVEHLRSYHHLDVPKRRAFKRSAKEMS